jgi:hypothetical protein
MIRRQSFAGSPSSFKNAIGRILIICMVWWREKYNTAAAIFSALLQRLK